VDDRRVQNLHKTHIEVYRAATHIIEMLCASDFYSDELADALQYLSIVLDEHTSSVLDVCELARLQ
jgi:hypothetical protein